ncbi:DUF1549 and DUF1553 domain-containing protein [soil metagenome]
MRKLLLASLIFVLPAGLSAQLTPALRLSQEEVMAAAQRIDTVALALEQYNQGRRMKGTPPAKQSPLILPPQTDDTTFLRRTTLDLQARLPDAREIRAFILDPDPEKRMKLVDRLLLSPASSERRFLRLADMLRVKDTVLGVSLQPYSAWLRTACASAMPYDQMVREMITATGEVDTNPATGWLLGDGGKMTIATAEALRVFLDEDIACARCHDNPFADWTQRQFYELAACFGGTQVIKQGPQSKMLLWPTESWSNKADQPLAAGERLLLVDMSRNEPVRLPPRYYYRDGKPNEPVNPALWEWQGDGTGKVRGISRVKPESLREHFSNWMVGSQRFAMVAALRTWQDLFGFPGIGEGDLSRKEYSDPRTRVEQIKVSSCEDSGGRSVPSSKSGQAMVEEFLEKNSSEAHHRFIKTLAQELVKVHYDLREFERILCHTTTYQRESVIPSFGAEMLTIAPAMRRLRAETIWNNLVVVQTDGVPNANLLLSHELPQVPTVDHASRILGRGAREWGDDSLPLITHSVVRLMMTGEPAKLASAQDSPLVRRLKSIPQTDVAIDEAFLAVLGRFPSTKEKLKALDHGVTHPATIWSDLVWALLNTSEFLFQR